MIPQGPFSLYTFDLELIIFTSLFVFRLPRRKLFAIRVIGCLSLIALFTGLWGWLPAGNIWLASVYFSLIFVMLTLSGYFCFEMPILSSLFCVTTAYASQHITYKIIQMFLYLIGIGAPGFRQNVYGLQLTYAAIFTVFVIAYYVFFRHRIKPQDALAFNNTIMWLISLFLIACAITLNLVIEEMVENDHPDITFYIAGCYDVICCVFALLLQFGKFKEKKLNDEYISMKKLWNAEKKQLEISKENMDYMRILAHDLQHEMLANGQNWDTEKGQQLDKRLASFNNSYRTDNEVLDLVLAERRLRLAKNGITLTCMADGQALNFMEAADAYSLFMNLVDNAIEALLLIEKNQRVCTLTIKESKGLIFVHEENPCQGKVTFAQGLPITTKKDRLYHGLGTKSMRIIAQKYGGELTTRLDAQNFIVDLVLVPSAKKAA